MTAKEKVLERASSWTEEQAERALAAAEGTHAQVKVRSDLSDLLNRAAALRASLPAPIDAATAAREARNELEHRH